MSDIGFSDANTFSMGAFHYSTKATCRIHGEVGGDFRCFVAASPPYSTGPICPKCFVDWVKANVTAVTPITKNPSPEPRP